MNNIIGNNKFIEKTNDLTAKQLYSFIKSNSPYGSILTPLFSSYLFLCCRHAVKRKYLITSLYNTNSLVAVSVVSDKTIVYVGVDAKYRGCGCCSYLIDKALKAGCFKVTLLNKDLVLPFIQRGFVRQAPNIYVKKYEGDAT